MREIKFRVWDKEENKFWYFILQKILERRMYYRGSWDVKVLRGEKTQYTGLKDINDKEIYEGDILRVSNGINEIMGIIKFGEYEQDGSDGVYNPIRCIGFYVKRIKVIPNEWEREEREIFYEPDYEEVQSPFCYEWLEVIGNIYENPELLEVE